MVYLPIEIAAAVPAGPWDGHHFRRYRAQGILGTPLFGDEGKTRLKLKSKEGSRRREYESDNEIQAV